MRRSAVRIRKVAPYFQALSEHRRNLESRRGTEWGTDGQRFTFQSKRRRFLPIAPIHT
jgi:hypothetical protein